MEAWLENRKGERLPCQDNCSIGRMPGNTVVLDDVRVSRRHALIYAQSGAGRWLLDFGSSNGILLNGRRIRDPIQLKDRDKISIAGHEFVFRERPTQRKGPACVVTTEKLAEQFAPTGHGIIVLTAEDEVQCVSELAQQWLKTYFASSDPKLLPAALKNWLRQQTPSTKQPTSIALYPEIFSIAQGERRLVIRFAESTSEQQILLLTEEQPVFGSKVLQTLGLTAREADVLRWVAEGKSNPEIGIILEMSPRTVSKHLENIFRKLGVESRTAALLYAMETLGRAG